MFVDSGLDFNPVRAEHSTKPVRMHLPLGIRRRALVRPLCHSILPLHPQLPHNNLTPPLRRSPNPHRRTPAPRAARLEPAEAGVG
jgi:hypothetical protein